MSPPTPPDALGAEQVDVGDLLTVIASCMELKDGRLVHWETVRKAIASALTAAEARGRAWGVEELAPYLCHLPHYSSKAPIPTICETYSPKSGAKCTCGLDAIRTLTPRRPEAS